MGVSSMFLSSLSSSSGLSWRGTLTPTQITWRWTRAVFTLSQCILVVSSRSKTLVWEGGGKESCNRQRPCALSRTEATSTDRDTCSRSVSGTPEQDSVHASRSIHQCDGVALETVRRVPTPVQHRAETPDRRVPDPSDAFPLVMEKLWQDLTQRASKVWTVIRMRTEGKFSDKWIWAP